jgi:Rrf2 family protein
MLSQTVGYAITALGHLGTREEAMFVKDLAEATGIPQAYLAKIVNTLARKGFLSTQRGLNGGVMLARPPEEISLLALCEAFDDPIVRRPCMLGSAECSEQKNCPAHRFWAVERVRVMDFLRRTTLRDVGQGRKGRQGEAAEKKGKKRGD